MFNLSTIIYNIYNLGFIYHGGWIYKSKAAATIITPTHTTQLSKQEIETGGGVQDYIWLKLLLRTTLLQYSVSS